MTEKTIQSVMRDFIDRGVFAHLPFPEGDAVRLRTLLRGHPTLPDQSPAAGGKHD